MDLKEIKTKSEKYFKKAVLEIQEKLRVLRFKYANKQLKEVREIRKNKKTISRILTILNTKKKDEAKAGEREASLKK